MKTFEKILAVLARNLGLTVVLAISVILFAVCSNGLLNGIVTAVSASMAYVALTLLYKEFKKKPAASAKPKPKKKK